MVRFYTEFVLLFITIAEWYAVEGQIWFGSVSVPSTMLGGTSNQMTDIPSKYNLCSKC